MKEPIFTHYKITYKNCPSVDYDYTIVENIEDIADQIQVVDTDLDDPDQSPKASVKITGIGMTRTQFSKWFKTYVESQTIGSLRKEIEQLKNGNKRA